MPNRALYDDDLKRYGESITHFWGIFMCERLPKSGQWLSEATIVDLDSSSGPGTHWVCYNKDGAKINIL